MIEKMKFLSITGPKADIDRVVNTYLSKYEIHLENALSELTAVESLSPFMEINPYMQRINAIWQLDECRFGNTKVLTPDGRYIPLGLWMTNFTMLMGKLEIEMHKHYGTF